MPGIIPSFEYDIFISYRHNDNRPSAGSGYPSSGSGQGWVTEFVKALQEELASTIKDPVSVYFDTNPHDGLLETHNVDKSLEGKLKCLIFIPIISQTYCDPKSFAWQHEFVAFNKLAKEDALGRDIKLGNGNVASRILPIKIHDLDAADKTLIENETGGVLRSIDFIYKEPGVNRPMKSADSKSDNQNKTDYRNQVNKVANAIKELLTAIQSPQASVKGTSNHPSPVENPNPPDRKRWYLGSVISLVVLFAAYILYNQRTTNNDQQVHGKSIAVLPFVDLSREKDMEYLGDGVAEEIINVLAQAQDLKVIARSSSFQFKLSHTSLQNSRNTQLLSYFAQVFVLTFKLKR